MWRTSNFIQPAAKYIRSIFHLNPSLLSSTAFIVLLITDVIIVFSFTFLLARAVGKKKIWLLVFILAFVVPPLHDTVTGNIEYLLHYYTLPAQATNVLMQIMMTTFIAYLIIIPLATWLGGTLGNKYRVRKTA